MTPDEIERRRVEIERSWLRLIGCWRGSTSSMAPYWIRKLERSRQQWNKTCALVASGQWPEEMIL